MLDPLELLRLARELSARPGDAELRRAISTAYYALFHAVLRMAAERFAGSVGGGAGYAVLYRGFAHARMRDVCNAIDKTALAPRYRAALGRSRVSAEIRAFATLFVALQQRRQAADYDPRVSIRQSDAVDACDGAEAAMQALAAADAAELTDILALLLVDARA